MTSWVEIMAAEFPFVRTSPRAKPTRNRRQRIVYWAPAVFEVCRSIAICSVEAYVSQAMEPKATARIAT